MMAPSNPVVSIGAILAIPGIRSALRTTGARHRLSPSSAENPARHGRRVPSVIGVETTSQAVARHHGARSATGILDYWLVHEGDHAEVPG